MRMRFRGRSDDDFADEIRAHVDIETDRLIATGMSPADARAAAMKAFGNVTAVRERFHESRARAVFEQFAQDIRYAARSLRRIPGFALVATGCLAIGISVNTTAFSVLNAVMFRDFPGVVRQNDLVSVLIGRNTQWGRSSPAYASQADWDMLRTGLPSFSDVLAVSNLPLSARAEGDAHAVRGLLVSPNFFTALGTTPAVGRFMTERDDAADLERIVVISHSYWQRAFHGRPDIAGQVVTVGTRSFTVIGVAPEGFFGLNPGEMIDPDYGAPELFLPLEAARYVRGASASPSPSAPLDDRWLHVVGRLGEDATLATANAEAQVVASRLAAAYPVERGGAFTVVQRVGSGANPSEEVMASLFVMAVPIIILLVACANLANQLLARGIQRGREIAVRLSLGATRARVVRQLLVETALIAVAASAIGLVLARWLLDGIRAWVIALPFRIPIDARVVAFTLGLALVTAVAFGLVPAFRATRTDLSAALKDGAPGSGHRRSRLRSALVVAQMAASLALIAVATLFARAGERPPSASLDALAHRSLLVSVNLDLLAFDSLAGREYQRQMMERLSSVPGVAAVGMAPFSMFDMLGGTPMRDAARSGDEPEYDDVGEVSGAWFDATHTVPLRGRLFTDAEQRAPPSVAVVDEVFARNWWRDADPIGRTIRLGSDSAPLFVTVVGVVPTRQEVSFRQPEGVMFIPGTRAYHARAFFYVRTTVEAASLIAPVREAVRAFDARVPVLWARTLEDVAAREVAPMTNLARGMTALGGVALALAALGMFGVLAFIVAQRRYEIGIRVALGARRLDVTWLVVRQALALGGGGVALGAALAVGAAAMLRAIMHGLEPLDLPVFVAMSATMLIVAGIASAIPARRASAVAPMVALRGEE